MCGHMRVCVHMCVCTYVCVYICVCEHMRVCVQILVHVLEAKGCLGEKGAATHLKPSSRGVNRRRRSASSASSFCRRSRSVRSAACRCLCARSRWRRLRSSSSWSAKMGADHACIRSRQRERSATAAEWRGMERIAGRVWLDQHMEVLLLLLLLLA